MASASALVYCSLRGLSSLAIHFGLEKKMLLPQHIIVLLQYYFTGEAEVVVGRTKEFRK
jgi:hypothetical protein